MLSVFQNEVASVEVTKATTPILSKTGDAVLLTYLVVIDGMNPVYADMF